MLRQNFGGSCWSRTFGILQIDPEPALKALVSEVTSEVGGLAVGHSPTAYGLERSARSRGHFAVELVCAGSRPKA